MAQRQGNTEAYEQVEISAGKLNGSAPLKAIDGGFWFKSRPCSTEGPCHYGPSAQRLWASGGIW